VAKLGSSVATRTITSDRLGRFTLVLATGRYELTPLRQVHTTGGTVIRIMIQAAATTWTRVRFQGSPRML
jgi:hypothetical protein